MKAIPFVHEGLGNSSYLIGLGDGRAALVDPDRSVERYLRAADTQGWRIVAALETHIHADFVSGAHELLAREGAMLFIPEGSGSRLPHQAARAGERIRLDGVEFEPIASPGHTPEHMSYVLRTPSAPPSLFSGGSLIVGGAARTDLIAPDRTEELTRAQYRTINQSFASLPDETLLYPTHGGGSFCSTGSGEERASTLGGERATNPALAVKTEEDFVRWFPGTFPGTPAYYSRMRAFNQAGPRLRDQIAMPRPLLPESFERAMADAHIIDVRPVDAYAKAHIYGSLHIPFRDSFAVWLGWLAPYDAPLLLVADAEAVERVVDECLLVGYENFGGVLDGGIEAWIASGRPVSSTRLLDGEQALQLAREGATVIDVREPSEHAAGHLPDATLIPLGEVVHASLNDTRDVPVVVYCGHGERASTAASILERRGYEGVANVRGGYDALSRARSA